MFAAIFLVCSVWQLTHIAVNQSETFQYQGNRIFLFRFVYYKFLLLIEKMFELEFVVDSFDFVIGYLFFG
jgi:hypothetical protein